MKAKKTSKMLQTSALVALVTCLGSRSASAVSTMTFEGLDDLEPIEQFYNGGTGGFGSGPGPNYGVWFTSDSLAIIAGDSGGSGNFSGALAPSPHTLAFFLTGLGDTMNVPSGFTTGFSFFYTSPFYTGSVSVYDGLNGTGTLLASLTLGLTADTSFTTGHPYDDWVPVGVTFSGTAKSAVFSGVADYIGFDNITIGSETPGGVPDGGGSAFLLATSLIGLVGLSRQMKRRQ